MKTMRTNISQWKAELITAEHEKNKAHPIYWSLTNREAKIRLTISVYKADKLELTAAEAQVKEFLQKLNS